MLPSAGMFACSTIIAKALRLALMDELCLQDGGSGQITLSTISTLTQ